jgi:hypothetical protein
MHTCFFFIDDHFSPLRQRDDCIDAGGRAMLEEIAEKDRMRRINNVIISYLFHPQTNLVS